MGQYLSQPKIEKSTLMGRNNRVTFASSDMQGWRLEMEDARIAQLDIEEGTSIFGVFDGHGGREVASFVAKHFTRELLQSEEYQRGDYKSALERTYMRMDELLLSPKGRREVIAMIKEVSEEDVDASENVSIPGCTAVVALLKENILYVANAGDSRCVMYADDSTIELSKDHKPENEEELERIQRAGGVVFAGRVNGGLNLSRSIGDLVYKNTPDIPLAQQMITAFPDIKIHPLAGNEEFFVLACDGVWDVLTSENCMKFLVENIQSFGLEKATENVLDRCLAPDTSTGIGCDNMTIIVVKFNK